MLKKNNPKKFALSTETVRGLSTADLGRVAGGGNDSDRCSGNCPTHGGTCGSSCRPV